MAEAFRRSGSATVLFFARDTVFPAPETSSEEFSGALAKYRFRTIENAASEEVSVGWVTPGDPSGETFEHVDMQAGRFTWLRMRIDKKQLPAAWLKIHRGAAERAAGRKLSAAEVRDLKADLGDTLLPRVLPRVALVDALLAPKDRMVILLSTSTGAVDAFCKLFSGTFGIPLDAGDPYQLAVRLGLPKKLSGQLEHVAPVKWPVEGATASGKESDA